MVSIEKQLVQLLSEKDCVVLPNLGGFIAENTSATINPVTHRFEPASRKIAFNEQLSSDEGILANLIAMDRSISYEEASKLIVEYVSKLKNSLELAGYYELKELGRFTMGINGKLNFDAYSSVNLLEDSFGLPEILFKPIERTTMKSRPAQKSPAREEVENGSPVKRKASKAILLIIPLLLLIGAGGFVALNRNNKEMQAYFPFSLISSQKASSEIVPQVEKSIPEPLVSDNASIEMNEEPATEDFSFNSDTKEYAIIIGSFTKRENAEKLIDQVGGEASLIENPDNSFYRVAIAKFNEKKAALRSLKDTRNRYGNESWIMVSNN